MDKTTLVNARLANHNESWENYALLTWIKGDPEVQAKIEKAFPNLFLDPAEKWRSYSEMELAAGGPYWFKGDLYLLSRYSHGIPPQVFRIGVDPERYNNDLDQHELDPALWYGPLTPPKEPK